MPYLVGLVSSFVVAVIITYLRVSIGWDPMSFWVNFILPFGAGCCGFLASLGFLIGARVSGAEASTSLAVGMLGCATLTFLAIDVLDYYSSSIGNVPLRQLIGLGEYLQLHLTHGSMTIGHGSSAQKFDLGGAGFLLSLGKAIGFGVGYMVNFGIVRQGRVAVAA